MISLPKSYSIAKKKKALALAWICLSCAIGIPTLATVDTLLGATKDYWNTFFVFILWFPMWSAMAYVFHKWATTARLSISESKIECDDICSFAGFSTTWENIDYVLASKRQLILFLRESSDPSTKLGHWVIAHNWANPKVMDLSSFIDHWKSGELKQDFERYAPHLFVEEDNLKPTAA